VPLSLLAGPANAGKVALLLERYLGALESDPILIVPNRPDVDRAERELLTRTGALVGGSIGTFDDLFERIARGNGAHCAVITGAQRTLLLRRVVARHAGGPSARFAGFADSLGATVAELESALLEPAELDGELAELYAPTGTSWTDSACGTGSSSGATQPGAPPPTSPPGRPGPSSRTASRT
jgi:hypothetical protein